VRAVHQFESNYHEIEHEPLLTVRHWQRHIWIPLSLLFVAAFCAAWWGAGAHSDSTMHRFEVAAHLFPSGLPEAKHNDSNWLTFAEYIAPLLTLWATFTIVWRVYSRQWRWFWASRRRGHVVVCGLGEKGLQLARSQVARPKVKVTAIDLDITTDAAEDLLARRVLLLTGDATAQAVLERAAADRASTVICACQDDAVNAAIAASVERLRGASDRRHDRRGPPEVFVHIANGSLAHILRSRAQDSTGRDVRLTFFNADAVWARALRRKGPAGELEKFRPQAPPVTVIFGATPLGEALLMRIARAWHQHCREQQTTAWNDHHRLLGEGRWAAALAAGGAWKAWMIAKQLLVLVDPNAADAFASLRRRYPAIDKHTNLVPVVASATAAEVAAAVTALDGVGADRGAVYPCTAHDAENLAIAVQARAVLGGDGAAIVVPATAWTVGLAPMLLDGVQHVQLEPMTFRDTSDDLLVDGARDAMAQEVHAAYYASRKGKRDFGKRPADRAWDDLPTKLKRDNRRHVDDMYGQLEAVFLTIVSESDWDAPLWRLADNDVEVMARIEHGCWWRAKIADGYQPGEPTEQEPLRNPNMVPWTELTENERDYDRDTCRERPKILARAGLRIARLAVREQLAAAMHSDYVTERLAAGETVATAPHLVPWVQLDQAARAQDYRAVDELPRQLAEVGLMLERARGSGRALFRADTVAQLAIAEHDRWMRQKLADGWTYGASRDDDARRHPDMVPWRQLPDDRREIDVARITQLPAQLARIGYRIILIEGFDARPAERRRS
jgi:hypothetical protein